MAIESHHRTDGVMEAMVEAMVEAIVAIMDTIEDLIDIRKRIIPKSTVNIVTDTMEIANGINIADGDSKKQVQKLDLNMIHQLISKTHITI